MSEVWGLRGARQDGGAKTEHPPQLDPCPQPAIYLTTLTTIVMTWKAEAGVEGGNPYISVASSRFPVFARRFARLTFAASVESPSGPRAASWEATTPRIRSFASAIRPRRFCSTARFIRALIVLACSNPVCEMVDEL